MILKLETMTEDERWLINTRNLTQLSRVRDWRHLSSSSATRRQLISQLSRQQVAAVYENYKVDFEMFNWFLVGLRLWGAKFPGWFVDLLIFLNPGRNLPWVHCLRAP